MLICSLISNYPISSATWVVKPILSNTSYNMVWLSRKLKKTKREGKQEWFWNRISISAENLVYVAGLKYFLTLIVFQIPSYFKQKFFQLSEVGQMICGFWHFGMLGTPSVPQGFAPFGNFAPNEYLCLSFSCGNILTEIQKNKTKFLAGKYLLWIEEPP